MTKPGQHPWAKDDVWTAGPDVGLDTKAAPPQDQVDEGYYRGQRVAPDVFNWTVHRNALTFESLARMQASSYTNRLAAYGAAGDTLHSSCSCYDVTNDFLMSNLIAYDAGANLVEEISGRGGGEWSLPTTVTVAPAIASTPTVLDADGSDTYHRIVAFSWAGGNDAVYYAVAGAWTGVVTWNPGAPGHDWQSVASDRNKAGGISTDWCIGGYTGAGTSPEIWSSADGVTFAQEAGFSAGNGESVHGLHHSCHPVGALGPDDTGNPIWLANVSGSIYRSADHVVWTGPVALALNQDNPRSLAYSRTSSRWVVAHSGTDLGDISYSDDNGASWTTLAGALSIGAISNANNEAYIACDGYGTFVVIGAVANAFNDYSHMWVSVDEGITWSRCVPPMQYSATTWTNNGRTLEYCGVLEGVDETPIHSGFFLCAHYDATLAELQILKSLIV